MDSALVKLTMVTLSSLVSLRNENAIELELFNYFLLWRCNLYGKLNIFIDKDNVQGKFNSNSLTK